VSGDQVPSPFYLYIGTMFHIRGIKYYEINKGDVEFSDGFPATDALVIQLLYQILESIPRLWLHDNGVFVADRNGEASKFNLPKLCSAAANDAAVKLLDGTGFKEIAKAMYPPRMLDLDDFNRGEPCAKRMRRLYFRTLSRMARDRPEGGKAGLS
jgi:hypothetical protein